MDKDKALSFLREHQPFPNDEDLNMEDINTLNEVRKYFIINPTTECISLFLNIFGEGSGYGVYQLLEDVFTQYSQEEVVPHLIKSLQSKHQGTRYWSAQIAASFPDTRLIEPLSDLIKEQDSDLRLVAYMALGQIIDKSVFVILSCALNEEVEEENQEIIEDILKNFKSN